MIGGRAVMYVLTAVGVSFIVLGYDIFMNLQVETNYLQLLRSGNFTLPRVPKPNLANKTSIA